MELIAASTRSAAIPAEREQLTAAVWLRWSGRVAFWASLAMLLWALACI